MMHVPVCRLQVPTASNRRGTEAEMISARTISEGPEMRSVRQLGMVMVRLKPLGMDRERRRYWLLARGEVREARGRLSHTWSALSTDYSHLNDVQ